MRFGKHPIDTVWIHVDPWCDP